MAGEEWKELEELSQKAIEGNLSFNPEPYYDSSGDCVFYFGKNTAYNGHWIDPYVTIFRELKTGKIIGFKVKCVATIAKSILEKKQPGENIFITFGDILDEAGERSRESREKEAERAQAKKSDLIYVRIPEESYAA